MPGTHAGTSLTRIVHENIWLETAHCSLHVCGTMVCRSIPLQLPGLVFFDRSLMEYRGQPGATGNAHESWYYWPAPERQNDPF